MTLEPDSGLTQCLARPYTPPAAIRDPQIRMEAWRSVCIDRYHLIGAGYSHEAYDQYPELVEFYYYVTGRVELFPVWLATSILSSRL